ncbi:MAG: hypothetical protein LAT81_03365 [Oceanicaulis sp.]|nr:hypothetical protein [Oceanicaulis sp.]
MEYIETCAFKNFSILPFVNPIWRILKHSYVSQGGVNACFIRGVYNRPQTTGPIVMAYQKWMRHAHGGIHNRLGIQAR